MKGALCWKCSKATGGCSWSKCLLPVDGWEAEATTVDGLPTHKVVSCPCFEKDKKKVPVKDIEPLMNISLKTLGRYINTENNFNKLNQILFDEQFLLVEKLKNITPHLKH